ncbi:NFX1 family protein [Megaselia abdita]
MSDNYLDFNTFLLENENVVTSNLNVNAIEFVPRNSSDRQGAHIESFGKRMSNNYENRRPKSIGSNNRYNNNRSNKRNDFWNKNREDSNKAIHDKHQDLKKKKVEKIGTGNEKLSQRDKLVRELETKKLECMICVEKIRNHNGIWNCRNCFQIFHLNCITKWANSSSSEQVGGWRCPACQNTCQTIPTKYFCFCGKLENPKRNSENYYGIPHSCGEMCRRTENCDHPCTLICHPGPCPPCGANVMSSCACGKQTKTFQCHLNTQFECSGICNKILNCESHKCTLPCHKSKPCPPCDEKIEQICYCERQERKVFCTKELNGKVSFSCGKVCNKELKCGNHKCKDSCHAGPCKPCKQSPEAVISCPCGALVIFKDERKSCLDAIPTCKNICRKLLKCGKPDNSHKCISICHQGPCPPCNKQTAIKCRCGQTEQLIKCRNLNVRDIRCKKRCTKKRSCGKHKCNVECCIDIDHICPLPCNYSLSCGKHKCDQLCHRGNCHPCYRSSFDELYCECGANVIYPPIPCNTKRPSCNNPCSRKHSCRHPVFHECHSETECPPCMAFTTQYCFGKHEQRKTIRCSQHSFSCGLPCGKQLICQSHKCLKPCHEGPCENSEKDICKQSCNQLRSCGHPCNLPCHKGECPESICKQLVEITCECGNRKQMRTCQDCAQEYKRLTTAKLASSMAELQKGHIVELGNILGKLKITGKPIECSDECKVLERNRRLAISLQIRNPDLSQKLCTKYSEFVKMWARKDYSFVKNTYESLTKLVKLAKESKQRSRSHSFPTMNREKRQLVHELCGMFGVDSVAYDSEPNRNVVATAQRDKVIMSFTNSLTYLQSIFLVVATSS